MMTTGLTPRSSNRFYDLQLGGTEFQVAGMDGASVVDLSASLGPVPVFDAGLGHREVCVS